MCACVFSATVSAAGPPTIGAATRAERAPAAVPATHGSAIDVPVLAYYYIWYDATTWNRAKSDLPLAGKYSSDQRSVMEGQVTAAKAAGIDGFIVSWKHTDKLNRRLAMLTDIAEAHDFTLVVIYQGLDFEREPLPVQRVIDDLDYFIDTFVDRFAFQVFEKPAVILSGSWRFSADDIAAIGAERRNDILLLGTEKDVEGIERLASVTDGNAYYWSSVNPASQGKYQERLDAMGEAVHESGGVWIPPMAVGFDARLVGGTSVVERLDGVTLRLEYAAAMASSPDALGIISWNEFSENSHIEPSRKYGTLYLEELAELIGGQPPDMTVAGTDVFDSSEPGGQGSGMAQGIALGSMVLIVLASVGVIALRRRRQSRQWEHTA